VPITKLDYWKYTEALATINNNTLFERKYIDHKVQFHITVCHEMVCLKLQHKTVANSNAWIKAT